MEKESKDTDMSTLEKAEIKILATLESRGKTATGFVIPEAKVTALGSSKKPQVKVTVHDFSYRTSIASMKGEFLLPVSAEKIKQVYKQVIRSKSK